MATSERSYADIQARLEHTGVIAVRVIDDPSDAVPLAHARLNGVVDAR